MEPALGAAVYHEHMLSVFWMQNLLPFSAVVTAGASLRSAFAVHMLKICLRRVPAATAVP